MKTVNALGRDIALPTVGRDVIEIDESGRLVSPKVRVISRPYVDPNFSVSRSSGEASRLALRLRQQIHSAD